MGNGLSPLLKRGVFSAGIRVLLFPVSALATVLTARALPVDERGVLAIILTVAAMGSQIGGLGIGAASAFQSATGRGNLQVILGNALVMMVGGTALGFLTAEALQGTFQIGGSLRGQDRWWAMLGIPLLLLAMFVQGMMISIQSTRWYNIIQAAQVGIGAGLVLILSSLAITSAVPYVLASYVATAVAGILGLWVLYRVAGGIRLSRAVVGDSIGYGLRSYVCCLLAFAVNRGVLFWIHATGGYRDLGQYSLALALNEIAISAVSVLAGFLFQRLSTMADPGHRRQLVRKVLALTSGGFIVLVAAPVLLLPDAVFLLVFGQQYPDLPRFVRSLLPYGLMTCASSILTSYWCVLGIPPLVIAANVMMAVVMVGGAMIWPTMGPVGISLLMGCSVGVSAMILAAFLGRPGASGPVEVAVDPRQPGSET